MASLTIRQLDDEVYERLRDTARANNRSVEAQVRQDLGERYQSRRDILAELRAAQKEMIGKYGYLPDSTPLIRSIRDED